MTFDNITTALPLAKAGRLRALVVTTATRSAVAPEVPTLAESGLPGFEVGSWQGVFAPVGTPPAIVKRLNTEIVKILNLPDVKEKLSGLGAEHCMKTAGGEMLTGADQAEAMCAAGLYDVLMPDTSTGAFVVPAASGLGAGLDRVLAAAHPWRPLAENAFLDERLG